MDRKDMMVKKKSLDKLTKLSLEETKNLFGYIGVCGSFAIQTLFGTGSAKQAKAQLAIATCQNEVKNREVLHFLLSVLCTLEGNDEGAKKNWDKGKEILGDKRWEADDDHFY